MLYATTVSSTQELEQIHELNKQNLKQHLPDEEKKEQGFVTWLYSIELLQKMHELAPSIVVKEQDKVVGYALVTLKEASWFHPDLSAFMQSLQTLQYRQQPLPSYHFYFMGQICIHKAYRGKGIFTMLYQHHKKIYEERFQFVLTEVSATNYRSIKAHQKIGFKPIHTYADAYGEWEVIVWDWQ